MEKVLIITGPTATGKTKLGIELAKDFNGEIISADSRQVYLGDDVVTGKDKDLYKKAKIKVWGLDLLPPQASFNVAAFVRFARETITQISSQGKLPIVVGGTGLYLRGLLDPFATMNIPPDSSLRRQNLSLAQMQEKLQHISPEKWQTMNPSDRQNPRRLIRALEVASWSQKSLLKGKKYDALVIGLTAPKEILSQKITTRRENRPDLIKKEFALAKKQLLYQKKFLPAFWFDITDPAFHNKVWSKVAVFVRLPTGKKKSTPNI